MKSILRSFRLPADLDARLRARAAAEGRSVSNLIVLLLRLQLADKLYDIEEEERNNKIILVSIGVLELHSDKGFIGRAEWDNDTKTYHGEITGISDVVTFHGKTAREVYRAFIDSINDYLKFKEELEGKTNGNSSANLDG